MNTSLFTLEGEQKKEITYKPKIQKKIKMMMSSIKGLICLMILLGWINIETVDGVSCNDALTALTPCGSYLLGAGAAMPGAECCAAAQSLKRMVTTANDRMSLCQCLKQTAPSFGVLPKRAQRLPYICNIQLNVPISLNVDCSRIK